MFSVVLKNEDTYLIENVFGAYDQNIKIIEEEFSVTVVNRGEDIIITGTEDNANIAKTAVSALFDVSKKNEEVNEQVVRYVIGLIKDNHKNELSDFIGDCVCITSRGKPIKAKTINQKKYIESIDKNTVTLGVGPAGTGKTFLAVAMAVSCLKQKKISRIILTRPAVEAGEKLGFLPGDLQDKVDPYLRPLNDALFEMLGEETFKRLTEKGTIEIAPLAYMRGRTLDDSFIILDEAQNTTSEQMKMFLTRLGFNSKSVITGDITQIDLPEGKKSGLIEASKILRNIDDIGICNFTDKDVVRHPLVQKIINAYENNAKRNASRKTAKGAGR